MNKYQWRYHVLQLLIIIAENTSKDRNWNNISYFLDLKYKLEKMEDEYF